MATVYVPAKNADRVTEGGIAAKSVTGIKFVGFDDGLDGGRAIFDVVSGSYEFSSPGGVARAK